MPIKERLGEELEDSLAEGVDDLDRAYLKELKESGCLLYTSYVIHLI